MILPEIRHLTNNSFFREMFGNYYIGGWIVRMRKSFSKLIFLLLIIMAIIAIFVFNGCCISVPLKLLSSGETATEPTPEVTETAGAQVTYSNDFTLYDLDKNKVSMHDYKGKIVVLNFWATWCPPCQAEIPDFVAVWETYRSKNIQFFGISDDDVNSLADFVKQHKISYPTLIDGSSDRIMQAWGIDAIPHTFILGENGEFVFGQLGMMSKEQLVNALEDALNKQ
jgi:peroxiredoxin